MNPYYLVPTPHHNFSPQVTMQAQSPPVLVPNMFYPVYNMPPKPSTHHQPLQGYAVQAPQPQSPPYQMPTHEGRRLQRPAPTHIVPEIPQGPATFVLTMDEIKEDSRKLRERRSTFQNGVVFFSAGEATPQVPLSQARIVQPQPDSSNAAQLFQKNVVITHSQPTKL